MARKRMIDPEFFLDEELSRLSAHARLLYIGTWSICDDNYHTFPNRPQWIKTQVLPYEDVSVADLLKDLEKAGKLISFESEGKRFWYIKNFHKHQRVEHPSKPKYPRYTGGLPEGSPPPPPQSNIIEVNIREDNNTTDADGVSKKEVNEAIDLFKEVNPAHEQLFKRKNQRQAAERMLKKTGGLDGFRKAMEIIAKTNGLPYAPVITTPIQFEEKAGKLRAFIEKNNVAVGKKGKSIISATD